MTENLFHQFASAAKDPSKILIREPGGRSISYAETFAASARFAQLLARHGVQPGDRVASQIQKSPQALFLYLACLRAGAIFLPLNIDYTPGELAYFIKDAEPRVLVCLEAVAEKIASQCPSIRVLTIDDWGRSGSFIRQAEAASPNFQNAECGMEDVACILYTSGTTGRSKGAMLTNANLYSNAECLRQTWHFSQTDVLLHALPIYHVHGLFVAVNVTLLAQASMVFLPKFDIDSVFEFMPEATVMMGVPTYYTRLLKDGRLSTDVTKNIRLFISGSAPLSSETHRQWHDRTGHAILERYGLTETNMNTSNPYDGLRLAGSVGRALSGVEIRITGSDGKALPNGKVGMIEVRGPNVFKGYWGMPEKTSASFRPDGFFITGDLGTMNDDGYIHIVGRQKDLIITGGLNVYPKEIESVIDEMAEVEESAVVGISHPDFGEGVTAFIIVKPGSVLAEELVQERLCVKLARFKRPKRIIFVDQFPRNSMGKIQKGLMRESFRHLYC